MNYHQLGKSALQISEIGFGCMSLAGSDESNAKILHRAIDAGINFFDTADLYNKGMNEVSVGKALKAKRRRSYLQLRSAISGGLMAAGGTGIQGKNIFF
jgi:aryl-alcohol dehydrogenase-like predicted oxidoreductase